MDYAHKPSGSPTGCKTSDPKRGIGDRFATLLSKAWLALLVHPPILARPASRNDAAFLLLDLLLLLLQATACHPYYYPELPLHVPDDLAVNGPQRAGQPELLMLAAMSVRLLVNVAALCSVTFERCKFAVGHAFQVRKCSKRSRLAPIPMLVAPM